MRNFCFSPFGKAAPLFFQLQHPQCIAERVELSHWRQIKNRKAYRLSVDHHLTTSASQPVSFIVFHAPPFFYNHHDQRRKLCTLHNFRRCIMLFACASQFSDSKGQRFESPRPHQKRSLYCSTATFLFCHGSVLVIPLLTLRGNIGHDRREKTDKIAHGISFLCWFYTLGSTRAILSVFVFMGRLFSSFCQIPYLQSLLLRISQRIRRTTGSSRAVTDAVGRAVH